MTSTRLVSLDAAVHRRRLLRGRAARRARCGWSCSPSSWPTSSSRPPPVIPGPRPRSTRRSAARAHGATGARAGLVHSTRTQRLRVAAAMDHVIDGPDGIDVAVGELPGPRPGHGHRRRSSRDSGCGSSSSSPTAGRRSRSLPGCPRPGRRARSPAATRHRLGRLLGRAARATSTTSGTGPTSRSTATPRSSRRCGSRCSTCSRPAPEPRAARIPAKGLTGPGYDGHASGTPRRSCCRCSPTPRRDAVADALRWRHSTLATGHASGRASSACAARRSRGGPSTARSARATGPRAPPRSTSTPTSPMPSSATSTPPTTTTSSATRGLDCSSRRPGCGARLGHHDAHGRFRIDGVTGPDEYSAIADNNVYTNLMAQRNLRAAADAADRHPDRAQRARHRRRGDRLAGATPPTTMSIPYDDALGVHPQSDRLHQPPGVGLRRHQARSSTRCCCTSRTSTCTASRSSSRPTSCWRCTARGDAFTAEQKARNFAYYERLTVRDSSLSACTQAVIAAEVGHLDLAFDYLAEAALMDLDDLEHNTRDGLHIACPRRDLDRPGRRSGRHARPRRHPQLRSPASGEPVPADPQDLGPPATPRAGGAPRDRHLHAARGRADRHRSPRPTDHVGARRPRSCARSPRPRHRRRLRHSPRDANQFGHARCRRP